METQTVGANVIVFDSRQFRLVVSIATSAFADVTVGTKVLDSGALLTALAREINNHDETKDDAKGQHVIVMPPEAYALVSAGVGPRSKIPSHYVLREHRSVVGHYLRRKFAAMVESLTIVVYTREAYLADPDTTRNRTEFERIRTSDATHVVVAVLASAGPKAPYGTERLIANLAGGNNAVLSWTADEIRAKAKETHDYSQEWSVVAD